MPAKAGLLSAKAWLRKKGYKNEVSMIWELSCMEAVLQAEYSDELIS